VRTRIPAVALAIAALAAPDAHAATTVRHRPLAGTSCTVFPADNFWHADISTLPVNSHNAEWLRHMSSSTKLHPDFGPSYGAQPVPYGLPVTVVSNKHATVRVSFSYADESDKVRYPLGSDSKIEGGSSAGGDRHVILVNKDSCRLYELWNVHHTAHGWTAGSGATWSLTSDKLRPKGWTSADAAGLAILPGLLRLDEVKAGYVDHAIRFTTNCTSRRFIWPARHQAGSSTKACPPMGARFRLKAGFKISSYRSDTQTVLRAMKRYGLVLADNGSPWYFQGRAVKGWPSAMLDQLKTIPASAFQAVDTSSLRVSADSAKTR
jgi:hypothetical protein